MKKILIIGATSAIAQEVAKIYALQNAELFLWGRNTQMLEIISQDLAVHGAAKISTLSHDLNDFGTHETFIMDIWNQLKTVDIVLLAHGILGNQQKAEENQKELFDIINSNFLSHASLLTYVCQKMKTQGFGTIAVISSVAGDRGRQSNYVYGSAIAAKSAFTDGLRNKMFQFGVHVLTIKLGFVDTPMTKEFKKGFLWAKAPAIAQGIVSSVEKKKDSVYLPFFWRYIMLIIKLIPERLFKRLKL
ncbi:MAG: SDR family oxidoreductase [Bdellovibrio sp.]